MSRPMIFVSSIKAAMPTNKIGDRQDEVFVPARNDFSKAGKNFAGPWNAHTMNQEIIMASASFRLTTRFQIKIKPI